MKKIALLLLFIISVGLVQAQDNKNKDLLITYKIIGNLLKIML